MGEAETVVEKLMQVGHSASIDWHWTTRKLGGESVTCQDSRQ
jgi:hypothetical protein